MSKENKVRPCSVCGSSAKKIVFRQPLEVPDNCLYGGYNVAICTQCGFCYADETLSQAALDEYYESLNKTGVEYYDPNGAREHDGTITASRLANILPHLLESDRILDVGCGTGNFLNLIKSAGYERIFGLEPSGLAVKVGREKYGIELFQGGLFDYELSSPFDFVIVSHVLEHVVDLDRFVGRLRSLLSRDGRLYIEVPDAHQFDRFANPSKPVYSLYIRDLLAHFSPEHVNFFSPVSLRSFMISHGFDEVFCCSQATGVVASTWRLASMPAGPPADIRYDSDTEASLMQYISESERLRSACLAKVREVIAGETEILVWGAGLHTQRILASGHLAVASIRAFVDSDPGYRNSTLATRPIITPGELSEIPHLPIVISSWKSQASIQRAIRERGLPNRVITLYPDTESAEERK